MPGYVPAAGWGTVATATTGGLTVAYPAVTGGILANDIAVLLVINRTSGATPTASGFASKGSAALGTVGRATALWKRCAGGESGNVTVTNASNTTATEGVIFIVRGIHPTIADPFDTFGTLPTSADTATPVTAGAVTPVFTNSHMFLWAYGFMASTGGTSSFSDPTGYTRGPTAATAGSDSNLALMGVWRRDTPPAGGVASGTVDITFASLSAGCGAIFFSFRAAPEYFDAFSSDTIANYATTGTIAVSSGLLQASNPGTGLCSANAAPLLKDGFVEATLNLKTSLSARYGLMRARFQDDSNKIELQIHTTTNDVYLYQVVGGTWTAVGSGSALTIALNTDYTFRVKFSGTTCTVYLNGAQIITGTTTWNPDTPLPCGLCAYYENSTAGNVTWDNLGISFPADNVLEALSAGESKTDVPGMSEARSESLSVGEAGTDELAGFHNYFAEPRTESPSFAESETENLAAAEAQAEALSLLEIWRDTAPTWVPFNITIEQDTYPASAARRVYSTAPLPPTISSPVPLQVIGVSAMDEFTVSGTAQPYHVVRLFLGGSSAGTTRADASGNWSRSITAGGTGPAIVGAREELGNTYSATVTVAVILGYQPKVEGVRLVDAVLQKNALSSRYASAIGTVYGDPVAGGLVIISWALWSIPSASGTVIDLSSANAVLDLFAAKIGTYPGGIAPYQPPHVLNYDGSVASPWGWGTQNPGWNHPELDDAYWFALFVYAIVFTRGDATAWSPHGAQAESALDGIPRDGTTGLASNGGYTCVSVGQHDKIWARPNDIYMTVDLADGYQKLASAALYAGDTTSATRLTGKRDALVAKLTTYGRRSDGLYRTHYNDATIGDVAGVALTADLCSYGLFSSTADRDATRAALRDAYVAGNLSLRGMIRNLVKPAHWPNNTAIYQQMPDQFGLYEDGGGFAGWQVNVADAIKAVDDVAADGLAQDFVKETLRQHRISADAPWEYINPPDLVNARADAATKLANARAKVRDESGYCGVRRVITTLPYLEASPDYIDLTLPGANGSSVTLECPHGHTTTKIQVLAGSAATVGVTVEAAPYVNDYTDVDPIPITLGSYVALAASPLSLSGATLVSTSAGDIVPSSVWGGRIRARVTSGSYGGNLTVRLWQKAPTVTMETGICRLGSGAGTGLSLVSGSAWTYDAGSDSLTANGGAFIAGFAAVTSGDRQSAYLSNVGYNQGLSGIHLRYVDDNNRITIRVRDYYNSGGYDDYRQFEVFYMASGVRTTLRAMADGAASDRFMPISAYVSGTALTVTVGSTVYTYTVPATTGRPLVFAEGTGALFGPFKAISFASGAQPVPPGFVLEGWNDTGASPTPLIADDWDASVLTGTTWNLRDHTGAIVVSGDAGTWPRY